MYSDTWEYAQDRFDMDQATPNKNVPASHVGCRHLFFYRMCNTTVRA